MSKLSFVVVNSDRTKLHNFHGLCNLIRTNSSGKSIRRLFPFLFFGHSRHFVSSATTNGLRNEWFVPQNRKLIELLAANFCCCTLVVTQCFMWVIMASGLSEICFSSINRTDVRNWISVRWRSGYNIYRLIIFETFSLGFLLVLRKKSLQDEKIE